MNNKQIKQAQNKELKFVLSNNGVNQPTYILSLYDFASHSYEELLANNKILDRKIHENINKAYHKLKKIGVKQPENHFPLFHEAFQYTTIGHKSFPGVDIQFNTRAYNKLRDTHFYHFDPDRRYLINLLSYHLLINTPYHDLLDYDGIGEKTAKHIQKTIYDWSVDHDVPNLENYALFNEK